MSDISLEVTRTIALSLLCVYLWYLGSRKSAHTHRGWTLILGGVLLLTFGSLIDITDNFQSLNPYVVIGDTKAQAFLEKIVAHLGGLVFLGIGLIQWITDVAVLSRENKHRERALGESQARTSAILGSALDCVVTIDQDGNIVEFNPAAERTFGYKANEVIGKRMAEMLMPPTYRAAHRQGLARYLRTGERRILGKRLEMTAIHADGSEFPVELAVTEIRTYSGSMFSAYLRDITERKRAEEELQRRVTQQAMVAQLGRLALSGLACSRLMDEAVILVAQTLHVEYCEVLQLLSDRDVYLLRAGVGWKEGLVGRATFDVEASGQAGYTLRSNEPVIVDDLRTESRFNGPALLTDHGVVSGMSVIIGGQDRPFGVLGAHSSRRRAFAQDDINFLQAMANVLAEAIERRRAEQALRESEAWFRELTERAKILPWEADARTWCFTYVGPQCVDVLGYPQADWYQDDFWVEHIHPDDRERAIAYCQRCSASEEHYEFEYRMVAVSGKTTWLHDIVNVVRDAEGPSRLRGYMIDITERKRAEEDIRQSRERLHNLATRLQVVREEERTAIAREIHDELGQALTCLKIDLSWLVDKFPKNRKAVRERTDSMMSLVDATLATVRQLSSRLRPAVLDDLGLEAAIEWQAQEFSNHTGCKCDLSLNGDDLAVDRERDTAVFRVLQEALTNVARHANATRVKIALHAIDGELILEVLDNGRGITREAIVSTQSLGLIGMHERAGTIGAKLSIDRSANGGTVVALRMPLTPVERLLEVS